MIGLVGCSTVLVASAAFFAFNIAPQFSSGEGRSAPQFTVKYASLSNYMEATQLKLSPDGQREVALGVPRGRWNPKLLRPRLLVGSVDGGTYESLSGTEGAQDYSFSPSGDRVLFSSFGADSGSVLDLLIVSMRGSESPVKLGRYDRHWNAFPIWLDDHELAVTSDGGSQVQFIPTDGKKSRSGLRVQETSGMRNVRLDAMLDRNTAWVVFDSPHKGASRSDVGVLDLKNGNVKVVVPDAGNPRIISGVLIFSRRKTLCAARFDTGSMKVTGPVVSIMDNLRTSDRQSNAAFDITMNGALQVLTSQLEWKDRGSIVQEVNEWGRIEFRAWSEDRKAFEGIVEASPDGTHFASLIANAADDLQAWICQREVPWARLAIGAPGFDVTGVVWSPDSRQIAYGIVSGTKAGGVYVMPASGTGAPQQILKTPPGVAVAPSSWSGKEVLCVESSPERSRLLVVNVSRPGASAYPFQGGGFRSRAVFSPDGKWIAYESGPSGHTRVEISASNGSKSPDGAWHAGVPGSRPRWTRDGRALLFCGPDRKLMRRSFSPDPTFQVGTADVVCDFNKEQVVGSLYDVLPDGHVLAIRSGWEEMYILGCTLAPDFARELPARLSYLEHGE